ncbi:tryptophan synthase subunit alpha [Candidatus Bathyarchaeota archaeon]|nr:tryptophan synthase subunit alpha [Candidatus Bathyarchaeota archaeon]
MKRIVETFLKLRRQNEGGLIAYITAGDPDPAYTAKIAHVLVKGGADIVELGIPFSDPIADGPVIQAATARSLKAGTTVRKVFRMSEEIRKENNVPLVVLSYFNLIYRMGIKNFFDLAKASGIDGVVVPDLPIEEADEYKKIAEAYEIDTIFLAAPSTSIERLRNIIEYTSGFLYLVSVFGVTGIREKIHDSTIKLIRMAHQVTCGSVPLAVGFGISQPEHVKTVLQNGADAVIVGSGFVKIIEANQDRNRMLEALYVYARQLKTATVKK